MKSLKDNLRKLLKTRLRRSTFRPWVMGAWRVGLVAWLSYLTYMAWWLYNAVLSLAAPVGFLLRLLKAHGLF